MAKKEGCNDSLRSVGCDITRMRAHIEAGFRKSLKAKDARIAELEGLLRRASEAIERLSGGRP